MRRLLYLLLLIGCLSSPTKIGAQSSGNLRQIYSQAENDYDIGRLEQAHTLLSEHLSSFKGTLRESAFRLLSLCSLGMDQDEQAEAYAQQLLNENPYYSTTATDPQRFAEIVNRIKSGLTATITTASSQEEKLSEVPVPTTLITEEMIRNSGARNLQEVLAAFVPGMNIIDCNDDINIAMRGIFSNGQEKTLIMLNGHRLNSYCTNTAAPDFSIALEKLKQIEVLRGPASSLYGGVALTAVVNLITKQGADVDGIKARAGIGNYGQRRADIMMGRRYYDLDVLLWGSIYHSKGEEREFTQTKYDQQYLDTTLIGAIGTKPSYEFGITLKWNDFRFMYNTQFSQVRSPFTISTTYSSYDYDKYKTYNGLKPGFSTHSNHGQLSYFKKLGKFSIESSINIDIGNLTHYQVISDGVMPMIGQTLGISGDIAKIFENYGGLSRYINGQEQTIGWQAKGDFNYINNKTHKGYVTFGAELSRFKLEDVRYNIGYDFIMSTPENAVLADVGKGNENNQNAFLQLKHHWNSFIFNAGLRYDHKTRYDDTKVNELSPRLALILVRPKWNLKLSYSKSFVDAPYLYRKTNQFLTYFNATDVEEIQASDAYDLSPESLHSLQLTFAGTEWIKGLNFELNLFHNRAKDLIFTEVLTHVNSGQNKTLGAELMASYNRKKFTSNLNLSWIKTYSSNIILTDVNRNNNTPGITSNFVAGWQATKQLKLHSKLTFEGKQTSYNIMISTLLKINELSEELEKITDPAKSLELAERLFDMVENELVKGQDIDPRLTINLGADYKPTPYMTVSLNIRNLLNHKYYQSGMNSGLVPQRGRWYMFSVGFDL
jgi:iron complex outermembrane receptor protein